MNIDYAIVLSSSERVSIESDPIRNVAETLSSQGGSKYFDRWFVENGVGPHITLINVKGSDSEPDKNADIEKTMIAMVNHQAKGWNAIPANFGELSIIGLNGQSLEKIMLATRPRYGASVTQILTYNKDLTTGADQGGIVIEPSYYRADQDYYPNVTVAKEGVLTEGLSDVPSDASFAERKSRMTTLFALAATEFAGHQRIFDQVDVMRFDTQAGKLVSATVIHRAGLGSC